MLQLMEVTGGATPSDDAIEECNAKHGDGRVTLAAAKAYAAERRKMLRRQALEEGAAAAAAEAAAPSPAEAECVAVAVAGADPGEPHPDGEPFAGVARLTMRDGSSQWAAVVAAPDGATHYVGLYGCAADAAAAHDEAARVLETPPDEAQLNWPSGDCAREPPSAELLARLAAAALAAQAPAPKPPKRKYAQKAPGGPPAPGAADAEAFLRSLNPPLSNVEAAVAQLRKARMVSASLGAARARAAALTRRCPQGMAHLQVVGEALCDASLPPHSRDIIRDRLYRALGLTVGDVTVLDIALMRLGSGEKEEEALALEAAE